VVVERGIAPTELTVFPTALPPPPNEVVLVYTMPCWNPNWKMLLRGGPAGGRNEDTWTVPLAVKKSARTVLWSTSTPAATIAKRATFLNMVQELLRGGGV
jgi:hypothetical protein